MSICPGLYHPIPMEQILPAPAVFLTRGMKYVAICNGEFDIIQQHWIHWCSKYIKNPKSNVLGFLGLWLLIVAPNLAHARKSWLIPQPMTHIVTLQSPLGELRTSDSHPAQVWVWYNCTTLISATGNCFLNAGGKLQSLLFLIDSVRSHLWNSLELQQPPRFFFMEGSFDEFHPQVG